MKRVAVLGSTGSIGRATLDIISRHRDHFRVTVLTAGNNIELLEKQIGVFAPEVAAVASEEAARELKRKIGKKRAASVKVLWGQDGISAAAAHAGVDFVLSAIVGAAGLMPTLSAVRSGKTVGLANKEAMVMAGRIMRKESKKYGARILPVDSEHSAIFQCIKGHRRSDIRKIILTASGGPFIHKKADDLDDVTPEEALRHPRWKMGKKITVDSATLMNKGFEVIEAHHLFGLPSERIDVVIHPESIVHSIVEFNDRSCIAQLSVPDMRGPIAYALTYPERLHDVMAGMSLHDIGTLSFKKPVKGVFPCLSYAYRALDAGGTMPSVMNASNEVAVNAFLRGRIRFTDIPLIIKKTMDQHTVKPDTELETVLEADRWARKKAEEAVNA